MIEEKFIYKFPFSEESKEHIKKRYSYSLKEIGSIFPDYFEVAYKILKKLIEEKEIIEDKDKDNSLLYLIMQILVKATMSYKLYEHFSEAYRKKVVTTLIKINNIEERNKIINKLVKNTFKINLENISIYKPGIGTYKVWALWWRDYLRPLKVIIGSATSTYKTGWELKVQNFEKGHIYLNPKRTIKYIGYMTKWYIMKNYIPILKRGFADEVERAIVEEKAIKKELLNIDLIKNYTKKLLVLLSGPTSLGSGETYIPTSLEVDYYPPCIRFLIENSFNGIKLTHNERLVIAFFLVSINVDIKLIVEVFKNQPDFKYEITFKNIKYIMDKGYKSYNCDKIKSFGLCRASEDERGICEKGIKSPLVYYSRVLYIEGVREK